MLVSGSWDETVKLWNTCTFKCIRTFIGHYCEIFSVIITPCNKFIYSGSEEGIIMKWRIYTGCVIYVREGSTCIVRSLSVS